MIKFIPQHDQMDCGPACIGMIASFYNKKISLQFLKQLTYVSKEGVSLLSINEASKKIGFETFTSLLSTSELVENKDVLPSILHWNQNHFVVLSKITKSLLDKKYYFHIADPAHGFIKLSQEKFEKAWLSKNEKGVSLFFSPTEEFYKIAPPKEDKITITYIFKFLKIHIKKIIIIFSLLLLGSLFTLIFPFLTEQLIDKGVNQKNISVIIYILIAQLSLFIGTIIINIFRNWLMLYIGTHLSIVIISDFLKKMIMLPIKFFDTKLMGDFQQRIQDNRRVEEFLTSQSMITLFSMITFFVFFGVLCYYDYRILIVYSTLTLFSIVWTQYWMRKRNILDYFRFQYSSENQESIYEILNGVTEMKLNQFEDFKIKEWEKIQFKLFNLNIRILKIDQIQLSGFEIINQLKNILITFLSAIFVVNGSMSLGMLVSISYIIGQMNSPINQLVNFFRSLQDAKLSLERLNEVQKNKPEEKLDLLNLNNLINPVNNDKRGIEINNLYFQYEGPKSPFVLQDINIFIPDGEVTAIVGASGSGKTTLLKLLLRFYDPTQGSILINGYDINNISPNSIRENTGVVMQDGYIFSETIKRNIATKEIEINESKLENAVRVANITEFIDSLPLGYNTKIGVAGNGISGGQKQRLLIARAIYKNPHYIFFDEATSSLDAENEKIIHDNLQDFFSGKTVIIIAHRLSTVKNANNIIVLKNGKVVEEGNHKKLIENKGEYFNLVKNQLELGS